MNRDKSEKVIGLHKERCKDENFPHLDAIHRPRIPTAHAAYYLALTQNTLRVQFMRQTFDPRLDPIKVGHQLLWSVKGIKDILGA